MVYAFISEEWLYSLQYVLSHPLLTFIILLLILFQAINMYIHLMQRKIWIKENTDQCGKSTAEIPCRDVLHNGHLLQKCKAAWRHEE